MNKNPFIRSFVSGLLLFVFTFSITPKQWLHDIVFSHNDTYTKCTDGNPKAHLHKAGVHCDFDNLVIRSPFVDDNKPVELTAILLYSTRHTRDMSDFCSVHYFYSDLRGPPAIS